MVYIDKVPEYDARKYTPSDPGFDVEEFKAWLMSYDHVDQYYRIISIVENEDLSLSITVYETLMGDSLWPLPDGYWVVVDRGSRRLYYPMSEEEFNKRFVQKPW